MEISEKCSREGSVISCIAGANDFQQDSKTRIGFAGPPISEGPLQNKNPSRSTNESRFTKNVNPSNSTGYTNFTIKSISMFRMGFDFLKDPNMIF